MNINFTKEVDNMSTPKCFLSYHKWSNSISLSVHYKHFMLVGCFFADKGGTGWEVHELELPSKGNIEIPFDIAKILSFLIDPENPLSGDLEEKIKNDNWCFITYPEPIYGPFEWVSGLMPYRAYLNAREAGLYHHSDYCLHTYNSYNEAKKVYEEITAFRET